MAKQFGPRVWSRDLSDAEIVSCPTWASSDDRSPMSATARGIEPADALLDLTVEHGSKLRWRTIVANDRDGRAGPAAAIVGRPGRFRRLRVHIYATWRSTTATCGIWSGCISAIHADRGRGAPGDR